MKRVAIIGAGAFGTAMACVARRSGLEVSIWAREPEVAAEIDAAGSNSRFLTGVRMPAGIHAATALAEVAGGADFVLFAVPAQHVRTMAGALRPHLRSLVPVVSCSKGVEALSGALMPEVLADMLPRHPIGVLSGPSFAREIAREQPCGVMLASSDWSVAESVARALANERFCIHLTDDVPGVAIAGAMKNVMAIASGVAHGLGLGENARATLATMGLIEASRLGLVKGARLETFLGLAGAGDFMLTAHSLQSRNTTLGVAIGEGKAARDVLAGREQVTEGAHSVGAVALLAARLGVEMPITAALDAVLNRGVALDAAMGELTRHLPALCRGGR